MSSEDALIVRDARVDAELSGARCDQVAAALFGEFSRSRLKAWIIGGQLVVNGKSCRPRDRLRAGDRLQLSAALEQEGEWLAQAIALQVVYEDEMLLVIDKPAGLVVHPAAGHADGTLLNALLHHCPAQGNLPRAGIVHRLDKDTSGLLVVAKQLASHKHLVEQLRARSVKRRYLAIVSGVPVSGGAIDAPLGRHPVHRQKMAVVERGGKQSLTHFRVAERFAAHSLLQLDLETGRTHQIRVHMAHAGYPLVGDPLYAGRLGLPAGCGEPLRTALRAFDRQALHAWQLGLIHPASGQRMEWQSSPPADMVQLLALLREDCRD